MKKCSNWKAKDIFSVFRQVGPHTRFVADGSLLRLACDSSTETKSQAANQCPGLQSIFIVRYFLKLRAEILARYFTVKNNDASFLERQT